MSGEAILSAESSEKSLGGQGSAPSHILGSSHHFPRPPSWWGLLPPPQEPHPAVGLRPRFSAPLASFASLSQQSSFPPMRFRKGLDKNIKTLPIFGAKECIRMQDFVLKHTKKFKGSRPRTPAAVGEMCSYPFPCPPAKCWFPSASYRLATALDTTVPFPFLSSRFPFPTFPPSLALTERMTTLVTI